MNYFTGVYSCPFRYIDQFLLSTLLFFVSAVLFLVSDHLSIWPRQGVGADVAKRVTAPWTAHPTVSCRPGKDDRRAAFPCRNNALDFRGREPEQGAAFSPVCLKSLIWGGARPYTTVARELVSLSRIEGTRVDNSHAHRLRVWTSYGSGVPHTRNRLSLRAFLVRSNEFDPLSW